MKILKKHFKGLSLNIKTIVLIKKKLKTVIFTLSKSILSPKKANVFAKKNHVVKVVYISNSFSFRFN